MARDDYRNERERRNSRRRKKKKSKGKVIALVAVLLAVALVVAGVLLIVDMNRDRTGNEKEDKTVTITLSDSETFDTIADKLVDAGVVRYKFFYDLVCARYDFSKGFRSGDVELRTSMSYAEIYEAIINHEVKTRETVTIRFSEGSEVSDVVAKFVENGIGTEEGFAKAIAESDFGYDYIPEKNKENRLEGFLYPDTYEFYADTTEKEALQKLIDHFDSKVMTDDIKTLLSQSKYSFYEILTLASIIEKEGGGYDYIDKISSVFHNRLDAGIKLQSDACYSYRIPKAERTYSLTYEQINTDDPYNTYYYSGLTPTPICNPTAACFMAALKPAETDYYYFCYVGDGVTKFARTLEEHERNAAEFNEWRRNHSNG